MQSRKISVLGQWRVAVCTLIVLLALMGCTQTRKTEWVDPTTLRQGPTRQDVLTSDQMNRIKILQQTFQDVDSSPLEKWVDDFKRDRDPDREIRIMEGMAEAYRTYCSGKNLSPDAKKDVYQVVLLRSGAPDADALSQMKLKVFSVDDAKAILRGYKVAPAPVIVEKL